MILHPIEPLYDENSRILILGSFPSVKSRDLGFFYGHKQNRFWRVISAVLKNDIPTSIDEKKAMLLSAKIALWDVISACEIDGSSDASIKNAVPSDISGILNAANIEHIYVNGKCAMKYYNMYLKDVANREAICLPSTSPANAAWSLERVIDAWKIILN